MRIKEKLPSWVYLFVIIPVIVNYRVFKKTAFADPGVGLQVLDALDQLEEAESFRRKLDPERKGEGSSFPEVPISDFCLHSASPTSPCYNEQEMHPRPTLSLLLQQNGHYHVPPKIRPNRKNEALAQLFQDAT